jgi:hypothetical protein
MPVGAATFSQTISNALHSRRRRFNRRMDVPRRTWSRTISKVGLLRFLAVWWFLEMKTLEY